MVYQWDAEIVRIHGVIDVPIVFDDFHPSVAVSPFDKCIAVSVVRVLLRTDWTLFSPNSNPLT